MEPEWIGAHFDGGGIGCSSVLMMQCMLEGVLSKAAFNRFLFLSFSHNNMEYHGSDYSSFT